ncbi:hypothetical protein [Brevibacillus laterosporus]|uniref:hypothetical protein n=1 Tax=Brevibacillus laterosporus TaxID=1465 RepID=UPI00264EBE27|nr:hypothetical protein [Brevibacillus laterosporus]MDN9011072.1 hypothetical protein [Brevibacillus laterosporus]MDO0942095.1 hypothetical protein [Brevibacillus laterosporus]
MSTKLFFQELVKAKFPQVSKVRVYPDPKEPWIMNFYLGNEDGQLDDYINNVVIPDLGQYRDAGTAHGYKAYSEVETDQIPEEPILPELVRELAMNPDNTAYGVEMKFKEAFPELGDFKLHSPLEPGVIGIEINTDVSPERIEEIHLLGLELIHATAKVKVFKG